MSAVTLADFKKIDLKIAKILEAAEGPGLEPAVIRSVESRELPPGSAVD